MDVGVAVLRLALPCTAGKNSRGQGEGGETAGSGCYRGVHGVRKVLRLALPCTTGKEEGAGSGRGRGTGEKGTWGWQEQHCIYVHPLPLPLPLSLPLPTHSSARSRWTPAGLRAAPLSAPLTLPLPPSSAPALSPLTQVLAAGGLQQACGLLLWHRCLQAQLLIRLNLLGTRLKLVCGRGGQAGR